MNILHSQQELSLSMRLAMRLQMSMSMIMVRGEMSLSSLHPPRFLQGE